MGQDRGEGALRLAFDRGIEGARRRLEPSPAEENVSPRGPGARPLRPQLHRHLGMRFGTAQQAARRQRLAHQIVAPGIQGPKAEGCVQIEDGAPDSAGPKRETTPMAEGLGELLVAEIARVDRLRIELDRALEATALASLRRLLHVLGTVRPRRRRRDAEHGERQQGSKHGAEGDSQSLLLRR